MYSKVLKYKLYSRFNRATFSFKVATFLLISCYRGAYLEPCQISMIK